MRKRNVFGFLYCLLLSIPLFSQHPYYYAINDDSGLPTDEVYDLLQDEYGFIWLGTNAGLFRFDGTDFIPFETTAKGGKAISHLTLSKDKKLWCQNFSGQIFSVQKDSLKLAVDWSSKKSNFPTFQFDDKSQLYITGDSGVYVKNKIGTFNLLSSSNQSIDNELMDIAYAQNKIYFIGKTSIGFFDVKTQERKLTNVSKQDWMEVSYNSHLKVLGDAVYLISKFNNRNIIWKIANDTLIKVKDLSNTLGRIISLSIVGNNQLWVGGSKGALCFDTLWRVLYDGQLFFPAKSVTDVIQDKEGNYWFSTLQEGLFVVPNIAVRVYTDKNSPLPDTRVKKIIKDKNGNLWLGFHNGILSKYNLENKEIKHCQVNNSTDEIQALSYDELEGRILVGKQRTWMVDALTLKPTAILGISNIKSFSEIGKGDFLAGSVLNAFSCSISPIIQELHSIRNIRTNVVFYEKESKRSWGCSSDGLWTSVNDKTELILHNGKIVFGTDIKATSDGKVWISTMKNGVLGFNNGRLIDSLPIMKEGIYQSAFKLGADGNTLWIVTAENLISYNTKTKEHIAYNRFDGLPTTDISDIAFSENEVYLATAKGLVSMPKKWDAINKIAPSIFISSFAIKDKDTSLQKSYTLSYAQNNLHITFKGIAFKSHGSFRYKYRLLGLDTTWVFTTSQSNFARYPTLPAGRYFFEVKALNEDGIESEQSAAINIVILKPFWQQWWFYLSLFFLVLAVVGFFVWRRIQTIQRKNEIEKRLAVSQLTALKSQMNPHFMFNALNSIQDLVLEQDTENAQRYLGLFSELTRKVLEASGADFVSLETEIEMLSLYLSLEKLRFGEEMNYEIILPESIDASCVQLPAMILQPQVENALKHGLLHKKGQKKLQITFKEVDANLVCEVEDNGVGRAASAEINKRRVNHKSFGTSATADRLRLLNEYFNLAITIETIDKVEGTIVRLIIPQKSDKV